MSHDPTGTRYQAIDANTGACLRKMPDDGIYLRPNDKISHFKTYWLVGTGLAILVVLVYGAVIHYTL